jgi:hypothetical protein
MALPSFLAAVWAAVKSVCQPEAAKAERVPVRRANARDETVFMEVIERFEN